MKPKQIMFLLFLILLLFTHCDLTEPPANGSLSLTLKDVSCTEAWMTLTTTNIALPVSIVFKQNGITRTTVNLTTADTLLYVDSLLPNKSYKFTVIAATNNLQITTNEVLTQTMDTTSHNFTWQTWTFGEHSSSVLYDVAIINENNIWAVGEIYMNDSYTLDSLGNWIDPYNAVHWDGTNWELVRIYYNYNGNNIWSPIRTILAFNTNDIWFGAGIHWNGISYTTKPLNIAFPYQINKMWGNSSIDFYIVGNSGSVARCQNGVWKKIESGTMMNLFDISSSDSINIYISGGNFNLLEGVLLRGNSSGFKILKEGKNISHAEIFNPYFAGISKTVWVSNKHTVLFGGNFLFRYKLGRIDFVKSLPGNYFNQNSNGEHWGFISMIRGNSDNDIIMAGEGNTVRHFNGKTWEQLGMPYDYSSDYTWLSVDMKANVIASVGRSNRNAIVILLKR